MKAGCLTIYEAAYMQARKDYIEDQLEDRTRPFYLYSGYMTLLIIVLVSLIALAFPYLRGAMTITFLSWIILLVIIQEILRFYIKRSASIYIDKQIQKEKEEDERNAAYFNTLRIIEEAKKPL